jgi:hypothetical protein
MSLHAGWIFFVADALFALLRAGLCRLVWLWTSVNMYLTSQHKQSVTREVEEILDSADRLRVSEKRGWRGDVSTEGVPSPGASPKWG